AGEDEQGGDDLQDVVGHCEASPLVRPGPRRDLAGPPVAGGTARWTWSLTRYRATDTEPRKATSASATSAAAGVVSAVHAMYTPSPHCAMATIVSSEISRSSVSGPPSRRDIARNRATTSATTVPHHSRRDTLIMTPPHPVRGSGWGWGASPHRARTHACRSSRRWRPGGGIARRPRRTLRRGRGCRRIVRRGRRGRRFRRA